MPPEIVYDFVGYWSGSASPPGSLGEYEVKSGLGPVGDVQGNCDLLLTPKSRGGRKLHQMIYRMDT